MPEPIDAAPAVLRLKRDEDRRLAAGHLWVFSNEVDTGQTPLSAFEPGELVRVLAHNDRSLGLAYVNPRSLICARLLETTQRPDAAWFAQRLQAARALRERLYRAPFYRLVHGEADALPGLVIDRYGAYAVVQIGTAGMERLKPLLQTALTDALGFEAVLYKNDAAARELEGLELYVAVGCGTLPETIEVEEEGLRFTVPLAGGQKTGWFFDQAANRAAFERYVRRGERVLDVFSYVGAWGLHAARAGAHATCIDSSSHALELAQANAARQGFSLETLKGDAFEMLERLRTAGERFDVVVVDPPAFAKRRKDLPKALAAYKRLNQLAMQLLGSDGILVSCSCSYHVSAEELGTTLARAARGAGKRLELLALGGQAPDHPVHPAIPETRYLKAYFCRVGEGLK